LKAIVYRLRIYASVLDWSHDGGRDITEIYIPKAKIATNKEAIFKSGKDRYEYAKKMKEIDLPDDEVNELQRFVEEKCNAENIVKKWLKRYEKSD
jgi:hypothetical protein